MRVIRRRTRAKRVIRSLELLAWCKVVAFGRYALEIVRIVLEASWIIRTCHTVRQKTRTSVWSGWCWGTGLDSESEWSKSAVHVESSHTVKACGLQYVLAGDKKVNSARKDWAFSPHLLASSVSDILVGIWSGWKERSGGSGWDGCRNRNRRLVLLLELTSNAELT